jgi:hypothetical protein
MPLHTRSFLPMAAFIIAALTLTLTYFTTSTTASSIDTPPHAPHLHHGHAQQLATLAAVFVESLEYTSYNVTHGVVRLAIQLL